MGSFDLQHWTRIGAMKRTHGANLWSAPAERSDDGAFVRGEAIIGDAKAASRSACHRTPKCFVPQTLSLPGESGWGKVKR